MAEAQAEGKESARKVIEKVIDDFVDFNSVKSVILNFEVNPISKMQVK